MCINLLAMLARIDLLGCRPCQNRYRVDLRQISK